MQLQSRVEDQDALLEQLDARVWAVSEAQTCLEKQASSGSLDCHERLERATFALAATEISELQAREEVHRNELRRVQAELKMLQCRILSKDLPAGLDSEPMVPEIPLATAAAAGLTTASRQNATSTPLVLPESFSNAVQSLEVRLNASCIEYSRRCDELENAVDMHLLKACDWRPAVDQRIEKMAALAQDCIMRTEALEVQIRSLRGDHDASCRRFLVLADQVASIAE